MFPSELHQLSSGMLRFAQQPQFDPNTVTPGLIGFIATFGVAAVVILLVIDMVRRIRRVNYRAQVREQIELEKNEASTGAPSKDEPA